MHVEKQRGRFANDETLRSCAGTMPARFPWLRPMSAPVPCPCGHPRTYAQCCGLLHAGAAAPDAEALMRSRYSAYVRGDADYLLRSWHASTRPQTLVFEAPHPTWLGLKVVSHRSTGADTAEVVFQARYRVGGGSAVRMREHSRFVHEHGHWYYVDAVAPAG